MRYRNIVAALIHYCAVIALLLIFNTVQFVVTAAAAPPPDFEDALVTAISAPTALAFTPDGRLLITTQGGTVRVFQNNSLLPSSALNINSKLCTNSERGLLGIAVDPEFAVNRFVYLFYTFKKFGQCPTGQPTNANNPVNRVSRFILNDNNTIASSSEVVLIDNIHSPNSNHNGGDIHFGKDNLLYISVGDGGADYAGDSGSAGANDAARDRHVMLGKILRVTRDGDIPATNPFRGANSGRCNITGSTTPGNWCQETFASGLRNPFRIAFDSNATNTRFFINDVGQNVWEEINEGIAGADYGWNIREGHCANGSSSNCGTPPAGLTNPIFDYQHTSDCSASGVRGNSITGGAFVPNGVWSAEYDNSYLVGEYVCGKIFRLKPNGGGGYTASEFVTGLGSSSAVAMIFGRYENTQALYYTSYRDGGQVRRIRFTGTANRSPNAEASANPLSGDAPLDVSFDASASSDPDNDTLSYTWNFGDGTSGVGITTTHRYPNVGTYNAILTVNDGRGGTDSATVRIDVGNSPPQPTIISPMVNQQFRVGETITLQGSAVDAQDGTLAANRLTWEVILHHNNDHTHPFLPPTSGNNITFNAPALEDLDAATGSYLEIRLTATDSNNLSRTVVQNFQPRRVNITFATQPTGLQLIVNNTSITAPRTIVSWDGYALNVNAPNQTDANNQPQTFVSWSDGGAAAHTIVTPSIATTYTAVFSGGQQTTTLAAIADAYVRGGNYANKNYGTKSELFVKSSSEPNLQRESYLRFNITQLPEGNVAAAKLRIYGKLMGSGATNIPVGVYAVTDTTWAENTITWNTKPASNATPLSTVTVINRTARFYELDVTSLVRNAKTDGRNSVSFALKMPQANSNYPRFNSRETRSNQPQLVVTTTPASQQVTTLAPAADAYIRAGGFANSNFGTATELLVKQSDDDSILTRESYLRFNIAQTSDNIIGAKLRIYGRLLGTKQTNIPVGVYEVSDNTWMESGITWNNKPTSAETATHTVVFTDTTQGFYELDVTELVFNARRAGQNQISFVLKMPETRDNYPRFNSREAAANQPQLVISSN